MLLVACSLLKNLPVSVDVMLHNMEQSASSGISDVVLVAIISGCLASLPTLVIAFLQWRDAKKNRIHDFSKMLLDKKHDALLAYSKEMGAIFTHIQQGALSISVDNLNEADAALNLFVSQSTRAIMQKYMEAVNYWISLNKNDGLPLKAPRTPQVPASSDNALPQVMQAHTELQNALRNEASSTQL